MELSGVYIITQNSSRKLCDEDHLIQAKAPEQEPEQDWFDNTLNITNTVRNYGQYDQILSMFLLFSFDNIIAP